MMKSLLVAVMLSNCWYSWYDDDDNGCGSDDVDDDDLYHRMTLISTRHCQGMELFTNSRAMWVYRWLLLIII